MNQCPTCNEWWVQCPCCDVSFCPKCMLEEDDVEEDEEDEPEPDEVRIKRREFVRTKFAEYLEKKKG
ncbi:hypothetical protein P4U07_13785 [Bacillus mycoides]|uniref:hypothetical protein n=1 Tax=Bacillus mycoides TaxID=1405 RepID=UPI002E24B492|nr:hypothetical protein [Bacillus mycoides]